MLLHTRFLLIIAAATTLTLSTMANATVNHQALHCPSAQQAADFIMDHLKSQRCQFITEMNGYVCPLQPGELEQRFSLHGQVAAINTSPDNKIDHISQGTLTGIRQISSVEHACAYFGSYQSCDHKPCHNAIITTYGFSFDNNPEFLSR